jgi:hypothetical protein
MGAPWVPLGAAWAAGAAPDLSGLLDIDFDATITIAHSDKENATKTWKQTFGMHPLLAFLDRPKVSGGEALAGLLRPGNAGVAPPLIISLCWSWRWLRCPRPPGATATPIQSAQGPEIRSGVSVVVRSG